MFYFNSLRVQYSNWPALQCIQFATVLANKGKGLRGQLRFGGISDQLCKLIGETSSFQPNFPDNELAERFPQLKSFTEDVCSDGFGLENYDMFSR